MGATKARLKRTEDPEVRRAQILRAAEACFCDGGFHPTTMAEIAARAGLSVGLIYQFFESKEALIEGIVTAAWEDQIAWLEQQPSDAPFDLHAFCTRRRDPGGRTLKLSLEIAAELSRNPPLAEALRTRQQGLFHLLIDRIRATLPDGGGRQLEARVRLILSLYSGIWMQAAVDGADGSDGLLDMARVLSRNLLAAKN
jgi:AcrR family transcriptional regulator